MPTPNTDHIDNWFTYHPPTPAQIGIYESIREMGNDLALLINAHCPPSSERQLALMKVRESVMWANAAIACNTAPPEHSVTIDMPEDVDIDTISRAVQKAMRSMPELAQQEHAAISAQQQSQVAHDEVVQAFQSHHPGVHVETYPLMQNGEQVGWGLYYNGTVWTRMFDTTKDQPFNLAIDADSKQIVVLGKAEEGSSFHNIVSAPDVAIEVPGHDWTMPHDKRFPESDTGGCPPNCPRRLFYIGQDRW